MKTSVVELGIPVGSLEKPTIELFRRAGWEIQRRDRSYLPAIDDDLIHCRMIRPQEMPKYIERGRLDAGVTGLDWIMENGSDVHVVEDLVYSKVSARPTRWVLAVPRGSKIRSVQDLQGKVISTEMTNFTSQYLEERGVKATVEFSWGATEVKPAIGLVDAVVDLTETGSSLQEHGLEIVEILLESHPQLVANKAAYRDVSKRKKIDEIALLLRAALQAEHRVGLKMNVKRIHLDGIVSLVPSLTGPTISNLYDSEWSAVEVIILESEVRDLIPKLVAARAEGIVEYSLNKVV